MLSPNTLRLLHSILVSQTINASAPREEIEAVLLAREELEAALEHAETSSPE